MSHFQTREHIADQHKWNPEAIFHDEKTWERAADRVQSRLTDLCTDDITRNPATLAETLDTFFDIKAEFERVDVYATLHSLIDTTDERAQERSGRVDDLRSTLETNRSSIETAIQRTNAERIETMLAESEALSQYGQYLCNLTCQAEHTADAAAEAVISTLTPVLGGNQTYETLLNADLSFPSLEKPNGEQVDITLNNRETLLRSHDRPFRQTVHEQFYDTLNEYRHTIAATFDKHVETAVRTADIRGYDSSLAAALAAENVPAEVYKTLIEVISTNLDPLHEHLQYKRKRLGVDVLRPWDLNVRLVAEDATVPYERAKELVVEAVAPLGEAYQSRLARGFESGWVDVYETSSKIAGAGTIPAYSTEPYIFLNYQNDVNWLFGLAHEAGHAMHAALTSETQPIVYGEFDWFISEVPSTVMEALLVHHILETVEDTALHRTVLDMWLERFRDLLYRRTRYAICEQQMHSHVGDGGQLTPDRLDQFITDGWARINAPVSVDERIAGEWMQAKYLNMWMPFYVYQYATGFSAALSLVTAIREEWDGGSSGEMASRYLHFLRSGSSEYPLALLSEIGVDLRSKKPFEQAVNAYHDALAEYTVLDQP
ncbi:M3 family oligoendopeptidase [Halocatena marina]|uniref:M3 family oligoendopeptidase n=1 Tax=Halocatena marina TaxID=2934937 RepID=UPI0020102E09|nr:M3 family oligoendopeptidase [Halocatena marina]